MDQIDWNKLFLSYEGRINRQPFWIGAIIVFLTNLVVQFLFGSGFISIVIAIGLLYPLLCVSIKRCHDRGKSGRWCLLLLIPFVNIIWVVVDLGILEGTKGSNEYGPDPLTAVNA